MAEEKEQQIIIKKYKKGGEAAHGGSWKVAYADFVTGMMAFFLLMWLLNMTSSQKKIQLSQYFQNYSIFEKGGGSAAGQKEDVLGKGMLNVGEGRIVTTPKDISSTQLAEKLRRRLEENVPEFQDRIIIADTGGSLRIELIDTEGDSFFPSGQTEINDSGKKVVRVLSEILGELNRKLIIEGHTDSKPFSSGKQGNWDLSTQRALSTRIEMQKDGIRPEQFEMVVGYADRMPFVKEDPASPKNRRVSIVVDYRNEATTDKPTMEFSSGQKAGGDLLKKSQEQSSDSATSNKAPVLLPPKPAEPLSRQASPDKDPIQLMPQPPPGN